jgi:hypothetical protein
MSCLRKLIILLLCFVILAGAGVIYYLSCTTEFSRVKNEQGVLVKPQLIPRAIPVR